jgi:hypothetical protein
MNNALTFSKQKVEESNLCYVNFTNDLKLVNIYLLLLYNLKA